MSERVCVIDVPGLSRDLLSHVPANSAMGKWLQRQRIAALTPSWPAVTCSVQATLTTGVPPSRHGIVANGIATYRAREDQALVDASNFASYRRDVSFWEQSNQYLDVPRFWQDSLGASRVKTALLFFQHSMPGFAGTLRPAADIVLTPKPEHGPDGKITSLLWGEPRELVATLSAELGPFPLMNYWGPMAGIGSSQWIARAATHVWTEHSPGLQFVYVPHMDYDLQRFGPNSEQATNAVRDVAAALEPLIEAVEGNGEIILLSEYAITPVSKCIQPNRLLKDAGLLVTRETADGKLIDYARSRAFALVDHQIAHVYVSDAASRAAAIDALRHESARSVDDARRINHRRAGGLQLETTGDAWFDYRWWDSPAEAPAFADLVDIHRKPGYDPLELFLNPQTRRISQNNTLIRGSHGAGAGDQTFIAGSASRVKGDMYRPTDLAALLKA